MKTPLMLRQCALYVFALSYFPSISAQDLPATLRENNDSHYSNPRIEGAGTHSITYHLPATISTEKADSIRTYIGGLNGIQQVFVDESNSLIQLTFSGETSTENVYYLFQRIELLFLSTNKKRTL